MSTFEISNANDNDLKYRESQFYKYSLKRRVWKFELPAGHIYTARLKVPWWAKDEIWLISFYPAFRISKLESYTFYEKFRQILVNSTRRELSKIREM